MVQTTACHGYTAKHHAFRVSTDLRKILSTLGYKCLPGVPSLSTPADVTYSDEASRVGFANGLQGHHNQLPVALIWEVDAV